jgi:adenosine deaminase
MYSANASATYSAASSGTGSGTGNTLEEAISNANNAALDAAKNAIYTPIPGEASDEFIREFPKVELHNHLDGALRPETIIEIAKEEGILDKLPATNPVDLQKWFVENAYGSLETFLKTFEVTLSVMQTKTALERVAFENVIDCASNNIIYFEMRFAPELHTLKGLTLDEIVQSIINGVNNGIDYVLSQGKFISANIILTVLRTNSIENALKVAELVIKYRYNRVVAFDIAGQEFEYPPVLFIDAFRYIKDNNGLITIHAGETEGVSYIFQALQICGANRIGHGIRIVDDIIINSDKTITLGPLAAYIRDTQTSLDICLSSNIQTKIVDKIENHPFGFLYKLGFCVTLSTDDKLMIDTSLNKEMIIARDVFNFQIKDFKKITMNAINKAFTTVQERNYIIDNYITPFFLKHNVL